MKLIQILSAKTIGKSLQFLSRGTSIERVSLEYSGMTVLTDKVNSGGAFVGIIKDKSGRKKLLKRIYTHFKTISYYHIQNEAKMLELFNKKTYQFENSLTVRFPRYYSLDEKNKAYSLTTEYISGKDLSNFSSIFTLRTLRATLSAFEEFTYSMPERSKRNLGKRLPFIMFFLMPYYFVRLGIKDFGNVRLFLGMATKFYQGYLSTAFQEVEYVLAHRDLYPRNIIVSGKKVVVLDLEMASFCEKGTDLAIVLPYYMKKIGISKTLSLIQEFFPESVQKERFVSLVMFHALQIMATEAKTDSDYIMTVRFSREFVKKVLPKISLERLAIAEYFITAGLRLISLFNTIFVRFIPTPGSLILCYHSISQDGWRFSTGVQDFKRQMEEIKKTRNVVSLKSFLTKPIMDGVVVTFDDGYVDNLLVAAPILKKLQIPATLFMVGNTRKPNRYELDNEKPLMNISQIKKLKLMGWEIGFHTSTHADLSCATDEELYREIVLGKKALEKKLGFKLSYFAYPRGAYSRRIGEFVKKAGFEAAFTVDGGAANLSGDSRFISRIGMEVSIKGALFSAAISTLGMRFQRFYMSVLRFKAYTLPELFSLLPVINQPKIVISKT